MVHRGLGYVAEARAASARVLLHDVTVGFRIHADSLTMAGRYNARDFAEQLQLVLNRHLETLGDGSQDLEPAAWV